MKGKRFISSVMAVMTFWISSVMSALPAPVMALEDGEEIYTLVSSLEDEVSIDETNFPDVTFRNYVKNNFDKDNSGKLSRAEIDAVTNIDVSGTSDNPNNITSLKGIEYFKNLEYLAFRNNRISEIDISENTKLTYFSGTYNLLTSLDVSNNTKITYLDCSFNRLTSLDASNTAVYDRLYVYNNTYDIGCVKGSYSLNDLPEGFDASRASDWQGAKYDDNSNSLYDFTSDTVTYQYDCGTGQTFVFELTFTLFGIEINEENFPDDTFRSYISEKFDTDNSGVLSEEEIEAVTFINVSGTWDAPCSIADLTGIEYFTNLKALHCSFTQLTSLDISRNTELTELHFCYNPIKQLDLSRNTKLVALECAYNELTSLDVSSCSALKDIYCRNSVTISTDNGSFSLSNLNGFDPAKASDWKGAEYDGSTSSLKNFTSGVVTYNYDIGNGFTGQFMLIDDSLQSYSVTFPDGMKVSSDLFGLIRSGDSVPTGAKLYIGMELNNYVDHRVSVNGQEITLNPNGDVYYCVDTYTVGSEDLVVTLEESEWSDERMSNYTVLNADEGIRVYWYNKYTGYIANYPNTIPNGSIIPKGERVCIRISSELYPSMPKLYINGQFQASSMNMDKDWQVWGRFVPYVSEFRIQIDGMASCEPVAEIDETTFPDPAFRELIISKCDLNKDNKLSEQEILQVSSLTVAGTDENPGNIESLKGIEYFTELRFLDCSNNRITSLDVSMFPKMYFLSCGNNKLTSLDVSKNPNLSQLYCSDNMLTEIDVTNKWYLDRFACAGNQISSLDLSKNTSLTWLFCSANRLTTLDLSNNPWLVTLGINENNLTSLDLSKNTKLTEYYDDDNSYEITLTGNSFDLSMLPGFVPSRATNWQGAEYDSETNSLINFTSDTVTYDYDCSNGHSIKFTLVIAGGNSMNITEQPADTTVIEGLDAKLTVKAEGTVTYQWQMASGESWVNISGATASVLVLDNVTYDMSGTKYRCIVTAADENVASDAAVMTVKAAENVTVTEVGSMSIDEAIKFVNAFSARYDKSGNDTAELTEAQMTAIEMVLEHDYR